MEQHVFMVGSVEPAGLRLLGPEDVCAPYEGDMSCAEAPSPPDCTSLLTMATVVYSRWFMCMRSAVERERRRQKAMMEEEGMPKKAKVPYSRPALTSAELAVSSMCEDMVRSIFGDAPADYARNGFARAVETGDKRSFKIRLNLIKARDSLKGTPEYEPFSAGLEECISKSEDMSGCIPCPGPRRLSKKEQDAKRRREELESMQPLLPFPDYWNNAGTNNQDENEEDFRAKSSGKHTADYLEKEEPSSEEQSHCDENKSVTVTTTVVNGSAKPEAGRACVHKARDYMYMSEIQADLDDGIIVPYESAEDVIRDMDSGELSPAEAMMFLSMLSKPKSGKRAESEVAPDISRHEEEVEDDANGEDIEKEDGYEYEEGYGEENGECNSGGRISYNPDGFYGGCSRSDFSDGGEWNPDDRW